MGENKEGFSDKEGKNFWVLDRHTCVIMMCLSLQDKTGFWGFSFWEMFLDFHQDQCLYLHQILTGIHISAAGKLIARNEQAFSGGNRFPIADKIRITCFFRNCWFYYASFFLKELLMEKKYASLFHCFLCLKWIFVVEEKHQKWKTKLF